MRNRDPLCDNDFIVFWRSTIGKPATANGVKCKSRADQHMVTKFGHLLHTHHPTAYIGIFTDLARAGSEATIEMLWHTAQIISNALARNALLSPLSHHLGQPAQTPFPGPPFQRSTRVITLRPLHPCDWCEDPHPETGRYSKDCTNV
jgi:hypothetical protein